METQKRLTIVDERLARLEKHIFGMSCASSDAEGINRMTQAGMDAIREESYSWEERYHRTIVTVALLTQQAIEKDVEIDRLKAEIDRLSDRRTL